MARSGPSSGTRDRPGGQDAIGPSRSSPAGSVIAPWSPQTIAALVHFQRCGRFHPYTCREDRHGLNGDGVQPRPVLVPTTDGWTCPDPGCDQDQHWADREAIDVGHELLVTAPRPCACPNRYDRDE
jgi:hypothetical protein